MERMKISLATLAAVFAVGVLALPSGHGPSASGDSLIPTPDATGSLDHDRSVLDDVARPDMDKHRTAGFLEWLKRLLPIHPDCISLSVDAPECEDGQPVEPSPSTARHGSLPEALPAGNDLSDDAKRLQTLSAVDAVFRDHDLRASGTQAAAERTEVAWNWLFALLRFADSVADTVVDGNEHWCNGSTAGASMASGCNQFDWSDTDDDG